MKEIERKGSPQREIVLLIKRRPGISVGEMARIHRTCATNVSKMLRRLEDDSFVRREAPQAANIPAKWYWTGKPLPSIKGEAIPRGPFQKRPERNTFPRLSILEQTWAGMFGVTEFPAKLPLPQGREITQAEEFEDDFEEAA